MPEIYRQATWESIYPALFTVYTRADTTIAIPTANMAVTVRKIMPLADGVTAQEFNIDDININPIISRSK